MSDFDPHARFYDLEHEDYQEDIALYVGFAGVLGSGGRVLELACGTGRCLLPLAALGYHVTGVDLSPAMLAQAHEKAKRAGLSRAVRLLRRDMRDFTIRGGFGLAFIALNSLMHLESQQDQLAAVACAGRHLAPGGRLVIDLFNPDVALPDRSQEGQLFLHCLKTLPGGAHLLHFQSPTVDRAAQTVALANYYDEISPDGGVKRHLAPFALRYLTRGETDLLMSSAGLEVESVYGSYEMDAFQNDSPRLIVVARRPA
jgi:SAM-dependent methyltransferase